MKMTTDLNQADIIYCECCGQFYDKQTLDVVNVPYTELDAEFAIEVMATRQKGGQHKHKRKVRTRPQRSKGFGNKHI